MKTTTSLTMPSDAAKKASTWETKCFSLEESFSQSTWSLARSISSAVQKLASAFLYISHTRGYLIGKRTNLQRERDEARVNVCALGVRVEVGRTKEHAPQIDPLSQARRTQGAWAVKGERYRDLFSARMGSYG
jgi:hypothetical protein